MKKSIKIIIAIAVVAGAYVATHNETPQEKELRYLARGNSFFENGDLQKARIEYRNAAKIMPTDPEISYRWGLVDEAEGNIRNAYANFILAEQQNPHFTPALLKIAHYQLAIEQYAEVQKRLDVILADEPDNAEAHALKAALYLRRKDFDNTLKEADLALKKEPGNITAVSVMTGLYIAQGNLAKAEAAVDDGIQKNPKNLSLLLLKVRMFEKPLNLEKINDTYQQIIKLQPGDTQLRTVLADIYIQSDKIDDAETTLRNAVRDLPDDWALKHRLVGFLAKFKKNDEAEKEIQSYLQAYPDHSELYFWLTELYLSQNQVDKAVALLEQIISKDANDRQSLHARSSLARINFRQGNKELANKLVDAVLAKSPNNAEALFVRASIAADAGRYQSAVSDLRTIIRDNPKDSDAHQLLAEILLLQGYVDLAIETLSQQLDNEPTNAAVQVRLAQLYNENKDPARAMKILNMVAKTNPTYPVVWEAMARIAISTKDMETAHTALARLEEFKGEEQVGQFLHGQIAQANGKQADATQIYYNLIKADPNSAIAEHALFELVDKHHKPEELEATAKFIDSLNTDNTYINTILGETYMSLKKNDQAATAFDKAIAGHSPLQDAYLNRAKIYFNEDNIAKTEELLNQAREMNKNDARADLFLADLELKREDYDAAIKRYDDIVTRFPDLDMPINNYASLIADHKAEDKELLAKAAKRAAHFAESKNQNFLDTLAWIYFKQEKTAEAESLMSRSATLGELSPTMHYHYGAILIKAGNNEKARSELEKASTADASPSTKEKAEQLRKTLK